MRIDALLQFQKKELLLAGTAESVVSPLFLCKCSQTDTYTKSRPEKSHSLPYHGISVYKIGRMKNDHLELNLGYYGAFA